MFKLCIMSDLRKFLQGGDLRSIANVDQILSLIKNQENFDKLFQYLFSENRLIVMRAADAIEKITINNSVFLDNHKDELIKFLEDAQDKEFKWHLALLVSRIDLTQDEIGQVWTKLTKWVRDKSESKIVRANSLQALHDLTKKYTDLERDLEITIQEIKSENVPSINARIRKFK